MDVFINTKKSKKIFIVLILLLLFNFTCPKPTKAAGWDIDERIIVTIEKLFFWIFDGIQEILNELFVDDAHRATESVSAENIIKGKFLLMSPNIFGRVDDSSQYYDYGIANKGRTSLRETISGWYYALRNLAIVGLLSILVYVGIRMILSTVSQDKAKYKIMFKDWLVALCLLFLMHYIMVGILNLSSTITEAIGTSGQSFTNSQKDEIQALIDLADAKIDGSTDDEEEKEIKKYMKEAFSKTVIFAATVIMNIIFIIKYVIRALTIIFLVLLAPITCITYPIDKISDGKAQAYDTWFKEFLYEVIIQPFHLLIYVVLIGSAAELAKDNLIYAMLCFGVMIPAEKFIKQMFGFKDKLGSPLGSFATGAIASQLMSKAFSGGGSSGSKGDKVEGKSESDNSIRESKLKPGLPDSDKGGEETEYNRDNSSSEEESGSGGDNPDGSNPDGSNPDGSNPDGSNPDGSNPDGSNPDGSNPDGSNPDGSNPDGSNPDGSNPDGSNPDGSNPDGSNPDGSNPDGSNPDGSNPDGSNPDGNNPEEKPTSTKGIYSPNGEKVSKVKNAVSAVREHRDKKLMAKYGTKNRLKAAGKYAVRKGAKVGKKAIKGAATLTVAAGLGAFGAMFGQGEKAAMLGASIGGKIGTGINNKMSSAFETTREYGREAVYATRDEDKRREKRVEKMMHTPDQIEKASQSFSKRNNGKIASTKELNQELEDRAKFKETGLSDSQIDDAMEIYKDNISSMGDDKAFAMGVKAAEEGSRYKAQDFEDPKKVQNMYDRMMSEYEALGVNQDLADENVRAIIGNAAKTHKIKNPALPTPSRKDAYMTDKNNRAKAAESIKARKGITKPSAKQIDHELEMGYNLRRAGIEDEKDQAIFFNEYLKNDVAREEAKSAVGENATEEEIDNELERRFEIKFKIGMLDEPQRGRESAADRNKRQETELTEHINSAKQFVKENDGIDNPSSGKIYTEVRQRLSVRDSYHINTGSAKEINDKITEIRRDEEKFVEKSQDKDGARTVLKVQRERARAITPEAGKPETQPEAVMNKAKLQRKFFTEYSSGEMADKKEMGRAYKKLRKEVKEISNGSSETYVDNTSREIIRGCQEMVGIEPFEIKTD